MHIEDGGTRSGGSVTEALVKARVEPGLKADGGHMVRTVSVRFSLHLEEKKPETMHLNWIYYQGERILPLNGTIK